MLQVEGIEARYGAMPVLRGVNLTLEPGELVALVGNNNAGKSTTLRAIAGLVPITAGRIVFDGQEIQNLPAHRRSALGITLVPEAWQLFGDMTVEENMLMGAYRARNDRAEVRRRLEGVLALFPALGDKLRRRSATLSGGERQMVSMSRALMSAPRLLLIDEPSIGLAPVIVDQVFEIVQRLNEEHFSILLVEQNLHLALRAASRGYVLENGTISMHDSGAALLANNVVREKYLGM